MKTRKSRSQQRLDLLELHRRVEQFRLCSGPFDYTSRVTKMQEAQTLLHQSSAARLKFRDDPQAWADWQRMVQFWREALEAAYPPCFWNNVITLKQGDLEGLPDAISFLEADPWFFRTGYVKTWLIRHIKPTMLSLQDIARLQQVILHVVDTRDDRDFRAFCRLARKVDGPVLRRELQARLESPQADIRRRSRWVMDALAQKDQQETHGTKRTEIVF